jgi:hypothetical protein
VLTILYKKLLHKNEFGQAHCEEWFKRSQKKLFCNFWTFLQVFTNFGIFHNFLELKTIENDLKSTAQCWAEIGPRLQHAARWPATCGRPKGRLGHGPTARSSRGGGPRAARVRDGPVARSPVARWRLAGGKVLGSSTTAKR